MEVGGGGGRIGGVGRVDGGGRGREGEGLGAGEVGGGRVEKVVAVGRDGDGGAVGEEEGEGRVGEEFCASRGKLVSVEEKEAEGGADDLGTEFELGGCSLGQSRVRGGDHNGGRDHPALLSRVGSERHSDFGHRVRLAFETGGRLVLKERFGRVGVSLLCEWI